MLSHRLLNHAAALKGAIATIESMIAGGEWSEQVSDLLAMARLRADLLTTELEHTARGLVPPGVSLSDSKE